MVEVVVVAEVEGVTAKAAELVSRISRLPESRSHDSNAGSGRLKDKGFALKALPINNTANFRGFRFLS